MSDEDNDTVEAAPVAAIVPVRKIVTDHMEGTIGLNQYADPTQLMGLDVGRSRFMLIASVPDIFVGAKGQIINGLGFPVPVGIATEFYSQTELWAKYNPSSPTGTVALLGYWIERGE